MMISFFILVLVIVVIGFLINYNANNKMKKMEDEILRFWNKYGKN